jgi:hypothetical protein
MERDIGTIQTASTVRRWLNSWGGEIQMRTTSLFAAAAAGLILYGVGGWVVASTPHANAAIPSEQIDIMQLR